MDNKEFEKLLSKLVPRRRCFVREFLIDLNGTQAAIRAGYSEKTAGSAANRMLKDVDVAAAIKVGKELGASKCAISQEFVLKSLHEVAQRCLKEVPVKKKDKAGKLVETGEYRFDSAGANRALELLGKHIGVFEKDNQQKVPDMKWQIELKYPDKKQ